MQTRAAHEVKFRVQCRENEPVEWEVSRDWALCEEILHSWGISAVFCATVLDESSAMACILEKVPVVMMVLNESHRRLLHDRLVDQVWAAFKDANSPLYEVGLAKLVKTAKPDCTMRVRGKAAAKGKAKLKGAAKGKAKASGKAKAKAGKKKGQSLSKRLRGNDPDEEEGEEDGNVSDVADEEEEEVEEDVGDE